ncbi:hypothetical protein V1511DRAFT_76864 [Dipodascopsis uninucleata]
MTVLTPDFSISSMSSTRRRSSVSAVPYSIPNGRSHSLSSVASSASSTAPYPSPPSSISSSLGSSSLSRKILAARRLSDGEFSSGRLKEELKCEACGKGYKHISSLTKHLWEHTPEWTMTSKLLISKHQQVQLLEAASILVSMTEEDDEMHCSHSSREHSADDMYDEEVDDDSSRDEEDVGVFGKMED